MFGCYLHFYQSRSLYFQEDWQKEKRDFLQSLSQISRLPRTNVTDSTTGSAHQGQIMTLTSSPHVSSAPSSMEFAPLANKPIVEKKAVAYGGVVKDLNGARERGASFKVRTEFLLVQFNSDPI